jgi:Protein of unknown function (DUF3050)
MRGAARSPIYAEIASVDDLRRFLEDHVFAVWHFGACRIVAKGKFHATRLGWTGQLPLRVSTLITSPLSSGWQSCCFDRVLSRRLQGKGPVERNQNQRTAVRTALMCGPGSNSPLANSNSPSSQLQLYAKENFHE